MSLIEENQPFQEWLPPFILSQRTAARQPHKGNEWYFGIGAWRTMDYSKIITIEPGKMGGKPCIRGLRITVYDVLDYLASGMTEDEILRDFPDLTKDDLRACLAFAADRERKLASIPM